MAKRKSNSRVPVITLSELFLLRYYSLFLLSYSNIKKDFDLPNEVWRQLPVLIDKIEALIRLGEPVTYRDLMYTKKVKKETKVFDERNILIYAMNLYRTLEDPEDYELFIMQDLEEKLGNPMYFKSKKRMAPLWFVNMEINAKGLKKDDIKILMDNTEPVQRFFDKDLTEEPRKIVVNKDK